MVVRCWLAGQFPGAPEDRPIVTDDHGRTWVPISGDLYQESRSGRRETFTELVARTDLVEVA
jgi:hypothetical protein